MHQPREADDWMEEVVENMRTNRASLIWHIEEAALEVAAVGAVRQRDAQASGRGVEAPTGPSAELHST